MSSFRCFCRGLGLGVWIPCPSHASLHVCCWNNPLGLLDRGIRSRFYFSRFASRGIHPARNSSSTFVFSPSSRLERRGSLSPFGPGFFFGGGGAFLSLPPIAAPGLTLPTVCALPVPCFASRSLRRRVLGSNLRGGGSSSGVYSVLAPFPEPGAPSALHCRTFHPAWLPCHPPRSLPCQAGWHWRAGQGIPANEWWSPQKAQQVRSRLGASGVAGTSLRGREGERAGRGGAAQ